MPSECVRFEIRPRAIGLGTKPSSPIAASTRCRVASATLFWPLITRETV